MGWREEKEEKEKKEEEDQETFIIVLARCAMRDSLRWSRGVPYADSLRSRVGPTRVGATPHEVDHAQVRDAKGTSMDSGGAQVHVDDLRLIVAGLDGVTARLKKGGG